VTGKWSNKDGENRSLIGVVVKLLTRSLSSVILLAALATAWEAPAGAAGVTVGSERYAGEVMVPLNKSQILRVDEKFSDLFVGNPLIADVFGLTDHSVYLLGKKMGSTNLTIYGKNRELLAVMDIVVTHDISGLKLRLHELVPDEVIEVRAANSKIVLSGKISNLRQLSKILSIAETYAGENVTNLMSVSGAQQVLLEVRFAEMRRSRLKELNIGMSLFQTAGDFAFGFISGTGFAGAGLGSQVPTIPPRSYGGGSGSYTGSDTSINGLIAGLEAKGVLRTLAEPNLVALSGDTASFLAGGEMPIPVNTSESGISIEFKEFGVGLAFTPTVVGDDLISLVVAPEVSSIDPTVTVAIGGFVVPGLRTRKARTTVEMRDGQSLAIAGLIASEYQDTVTQFPFLGDLPVLGPLFRSPDFNRAETELVIIVTPRLIKPVKPSQLRLSTDDFIPPSDMDLFVLGRPEDPRSGMGYGGKMDGKFGHVIK
jgi:pilus assembly protein CpaC